MDTEERTQPLWETLEALIEQGDVARVVERVEQENTSDLGHAIARLEDEDTTRLLTMLPPNVAADLVEELEHAQAADLIEELPADAAAAIVDHMQSDEQADLLYELDEEDAEAILQEMSPQEVADVRRLSKYGPDTAGGIMITEYLAYDDNQRVDDVLLDLRRNVEQYAEYDVQYVYVVEAATGKLLGMVRLRDLVLSPANDPLPKLINTQTRLVEAEADLDALDRFFSRYSFQAAPVVDEQGRLMGVVRRSHVEEAMADRSEKVMMRLGGIVMGEELRTMTIASRTARRLAYLLPLFALALITVNVIGLFEETIGQMPGIVMFLPLVAGLCGNAGNQAVAVSMRELSLGLARPEDVMYVLLRELAVGVLVGLLLGMLVAAVAWSLRRDAHLALVVGSAIPITVVVAVSVGGCVPLIFKGLKLDPAMLSGPVVTTVVDLTGYSIVLVLLTLALYWWVT